MYRFCQLPPTFDPARLRSDLELAADTRWAPHYVPSNYEGEWSAIALRSVDGRIENACPDPAASLGAYGETPILSVCEYLRQVLGAFDCPVASARLLKLAAGSRVKEHVDHDLGATSGWARLHIPILTHPQVEFYVENERVVMSEGECWYIDATLPHRLANPGPTDRVHMVFDCVVNDWLRGQMQAGGYTARKPDYFESRGVRETDVGRVAEALRGMGTDVSERLARELERNG